MGMPGRIELADIFRVHGEAYLAGHALARTFIGRFLLHVLPPGLKRIRHYGILASCHKKEKLATCRNALNATPPEVAVIEAAAAFMQRVAHLDITCCSHCRVGRLRVIDVIAPRHWPCHTTGPPP